MPIVCACKKLDMDSTRRLIMAGKVDEGRQPIIEMCPLHASATRLYTLIECIASGEYGLTEIVRAAEQIDQDLKTMMLPCARNFIGEDGQLHRCRTHIFRGGHGKGHHNCACGVTTPAHLDPAGPAIFEGPVCETARKS